MVADTFNLGPLSLRWYTALLILAVIIPFFLIRRQALKFGIKKEQVDNLVLLVVPAGIIGARIYHVVDQWYYYQVHLAEIFYLWQGGLGIFGGLLCGLLVSWFYCRQKKINLVPLLDLITPFLLLGQAIGRMGNYFNQEGYGPSTQLPWGIYIAKEQTTVHPTFFYEALWDLASFLILVTVRPRLKPGQVTSLYLIVYGSGRLLAEYFRVDTFKTGEVKIGYIVSLGLVLVGLYLLRKFTRMYQSVQGVL